MLPHERAGKRRIGDHPKVQHKWAEPARIAALKGEERARARVAYYLNLAAAFHNKNGTLPKLSQALGLGESALSVARKRGRVSPDIAIRIETELGREHFPRELFNEIFVVAEK